MKVIALTKFMATYNCHGSYNQNESDMKNHGQIIDNKTTMVRFKYIKKEESNGNTSFDAILSSVMNNCTISPKSKGIQ